MNFMCLYDPTIPWLLALVLFLILSISTYFIIKDLPKNLNQGPPAAKRDDNERD